MNVCVIPARGGSKRIPGKNIKFFLGKPIIAYSIEVALNSGLFDRVIVSTDDELIAQVARQYHAEVPFIRPKELSDDFTGTEQVIEHAVNWLLSQGHNINYVCCIYATSPLIQEKYLRQGFEELKDSDKLFSFSVASFEYPVQRAIKIDNGEISMLYPQYFTTRSQDLEEVYHDAGQFYWRKLESFFKNEKIFSNKSIPILLPRYLVQDIDSLEDWKTAEIMYKTLMLRS